ncbi:UNKNOWN [Stylonychia lemnae]|uniref:Uncharacterized protein n=1 Tax=Stylonychia lemnae TaxID=5949 RepID=A0A078BDP3_STYLE|nr:UNKNOWN [Stylonychia lemnae]|eukprot:CDW91703.1 UNKNOWN [Stylonychia lemnae]
MSNIVHSIEQNGNTTRLSVIDPGSYLFPHLQRFFKRPSSLSPIKMAQADAYSQNQGILSAQPTLSNFNSIAINAHGNPQTTRTPNIINQRSETMLAQIRNIPLRNKYIQSINCENLSSVTQRLQVKSLQKRLKKRKKYLIKNEHIPQIQTIPPLTQKVSVLRSNIEEALGLPKHDDYQNKRNTPFMNDSKQSTPIKFLSQIQLSQPRGAYQLFKTDKFDFTRTIVNFQQKELQLRQPDPPLSSQPSLKEGLIKRERKSKKQLPKTKSQTVLQLEQQRQKFAQLMNVNYDEQFRSLERDIKKINPEKFERKAKIRQHSVKFIDQIESDYY